MSACWAPFSPILYAHRRFGSTRDPDRRFSPGDAQLRENIEFKAKVRDPERVHATARELSGDEPQLLRQIDTFFATAHGRLKLREFSSTLGEIIYYDRPDTAEPSRSKYEIAHVKDPEAVRRVLAAALEVVGTVRKTRSLYLVGRTRIHIDEVEGLGAFLEVEVVLDDGDRHDDGEREARDLLAKLSVAESDLIAQAYVDLLD
jgi:predicted adenylyl cyclase CyaB